MNGLSLCSGIGGLDLGLSLAVKGYRAVCYIEIEPYCQEVLLARMADGVLDRAPIWGDLKQFDGTEWRGLVDVVHGGYPCQPFSLAGKRAGEADPRHLWPDVARVVRECEPEWCFFENVAGHLTLGFDVVARELEAMDYRVTAGLFTAAEVGAPHRRQRLYILAHRDGRRPQGEWGSRVLDGERSSQWHDIDGRGSADSAVVHSDDAGLEGRREPEREGSSADVAYRDGRGLVDAIHTAERGAGVGQGQPARSAGVGNPDDPRLEGRGEPEREGPDERAAWPPGPEERDRWATVLARWPDLAPAVAPAQSAVRGVAHGLPHRVDRLKALGNAVVPDVAALAWQTLVHELT